MAWSAAQRAAVSQRMQKYWKKRRAAGTKAHPHRGRRARTVRQPVIANVHLTDLVAAQGGQEVSGNGADPRHWPVPKVEGRVVVRFSGQEMLMSLDEARQLQTGLTSLLSAVQAVSALP